ncbi:MAG TPA: hypothetical protein VF329_02195 [Gammaproteobacteria bacterium]
MSSKRPDGETAARAAAPLLPDIGELLELAVPASPIAEAVEAYSALGFRGVPVADFVSEPYAAATDGRLTIGLHENELDGPVPTFVRPDVKAQARRLEAAGIELERTELGDDEFHRVRFCDPDGLPILLLEARTFPPVADHATTVSACGAFVELSVATRSLARAERFWTALGLSFVARRDAPHPWLTLAGRGLVLGLHETRRFTRALTFRAGQLDARTEYLRAKGFEVRRGAPITADASGSVTLFLPGDVSFFLIEDDRAEEPAGA